MPQRWLHFDFIACGVEEAEFEHADVLGLFQFEPHFVPPHPFGSDAAQAAAGEVGVDVGMDDECVGVFVLRGDEVFEAGFDFIDHDETLLDVASAVAEGAFFLHVDFEGRTDAVACDLHQAEFAQRQDGVPRFVAFHLFGHEVEEGFAVLGLGHIDKVDDDYTSHVAQAQLACYLFGTLDVDLKGGIFLAVARFDVVAAIDVDDVHSFGVLNVEVDSRADGYDAAKRAAYIALHAEGFEDGGFQFIEFHDVFFARAHLADTLSHLGVEFRGIDGDGIEVVGQKVADEGRGGVEFGVYFAWGTDALKFFGHLLPAVEELAEVGVEFGHAFAFGHCADDDAEVLWADALQQAAEPVALGRASDFLRDGYFIAEWAEHEVVASYRDVARQFWAFGGDGFFRDLHQYGLTRFKHVTKVTHFFEYRLNGEVFEGGHVSVAVHGQAEVFADGIIVWAEVEVVHESLFVATHVNESCVETLHDFFDAPEVDVAYGVLASRLLAVKLNDAFIL